MTITEDDIAEPETQTVSPDEVAGQGFDYSNASGVVEPGNIDLTNRPKINNADGTVSTERSFSIGTDKGEVLIPEIVNGKRVTKQEAIQHYKDTGEHLGIFKDVKSANTTAEAIHNRDQSFTVNPEDVAPPEAAPSWLTRFDQLAQRGVRRALNLPVSRPPTFGEVKEQGLQDIQELTSAPAEAVNVPRPETVTWANLPQTALHDVVGFMESPAGAAAPALGLLPKTGQALVSAGFGSQMMTDAIQKVREGKYPEAVESAAFGLLGAKGAKEAIAPEKAPTVAPPEGFEVTKAGVTEPPPVPIEFLPEKSTVTADLTRTIIDARKDLLSEAQKLQVQADIAQKVSGTVPGEIQNRIDAINEELNHPTVGVPVNPDTPVDVVLQTQGKPHTVGPDEVAETVGESPASTTAGEIPVGQQQAELPAEVGVGVGPEGTAGGQGRGVPISAGMSRATIEEQIAAGVLPEEALVIGEGWNPTTSAARGDYLVNKGVNPDVVLDAMQGKRALPVVDGKKIRMEDTVAVLQSESRRLAAERVAAQAKFGIGSPQAKAAQLTENHWLGTARPKAGGLVNKLMRSFEDVTPVDLSNYDEMYTKAAQLAEGKGVADGQQFQIRKRARKAEVAIGATGDALTKRDEVLQRTLPKVKTPTKAEIKAMFDDLTEKLTPCQ